MLNCDLRSHNRNYVLVIVLICRLCCVQRLSCFKKCIGVKTMCGRCLRLSAHNYNCVLLTLASRHTKCFCYLPLDTFTHDIREFCTCLVSDFDLFSVVYSRYFFINFFYNIFYFFMSACCLVHLREKCSFAEILLVLLRSPVLPFFVCILIR